MHQEVTSDQKLLSRRLLTKTNRMPCWAERLFPAQCCSLGIHPRGYCGPTEPDHEHLPLERQPHLTDGGGGMKYLLCEL